MNPNSIIEYLNNNDLDDVEKIDYKEDILVVRFLYEFDELELDSARAYSNDESEDEENSENWYEEFFYPYLSDLAIDNVGEIMEEVMDEFDIESQYVSYEIDTEDNEAMEFISIFHSKDKEVDIEEILDELNI